MEIKHLNCGWLHAPPLRPACCHCLMITDGRNVVLIDTGIGEKDIADPISRIGQELIDIGGVKLIPELTAANQLVEMGFHRDAVTDIILTHCDHDHVGGLSDFPNAKVHVSDEELADVKLGNPRYCQSQFADDPQWVIYSEDNAEVFGFESRKVCTSIDIEVFLVPLFGHTRGHCGVGIHLDNHRIFHVGDAYYLRAELEDANHPIDELATMAAVDNTQRKATLERLRRLFVEQSANLEMFGYHDLSELPEYVRPVDAFFQVE